MKVLVRSALVAGLSFSQSLVDLQTQAKNIDFSSAPFTRPVKTSTSLPATCAVGDMLFKTDAPPGANLYACTSLNTWTLEAGGGTTPSGLTSTAAGAALTIGTDCSISSPCNVSFTNRVLSFTGSAVATTSTGTSPSGVYVFVNATTGRITLANSGAAAISCNANCDVVSGTGFPADGIPLYQWPVTVAGVWDSYQSTFDKRALYNTAPVTVGANLAVSVVNGRQIVSYDATSGLTPTGPVDATGSNLTKPHRTVASNPAGACPSNSEVVLSTASGNLYSCLAGTWHAAGDGGVVVAGGGGNGNVAVLNAGGNLDPSAGGGGVMTWSGSTLTIPGSQGFLFNNANAGANCSGSLPLVESQSNVFRITLTGNCTTTSTGALSGQVLTFFICQDGTGSRTLTWPGSYHGGMTVGSAANVCSVQQFVGTGTEYYAVTSGVVNP